MSPPPALPVPGPLARVAARALAWSPDERFTSAEEMRAWLLDAAQPVQPASHGELAAWVAEARIEVARAAAAQVSTARTDKVTGSSTRSVDQETRATGSAGPSET
jgi:hypothetical protein